MGTAGRAPPGWGLSRAIRALGKLTVFRHRSGTQNNQVQGPVGYRMAAPTHHRANRGIHAGEMTIRSTGNQ